jgi:phosphopantothenate-cysteine ligase
LKAGYAVIFLHRLHSLRPFSRHYSHSLNPFLDLLSITESTRPDGAPSITVDPKHAAALLPVLQSYHVAQARGTLLSVEFQTINEYLWLLRAATESMASLGRRGMFYLAAAVSDFFLPEDKVVRPPVWRRLTTGRAQDPVQQGDPLARDGPGAQGTQAARARVDARGVYRQLQGGSWPAEAR